MAARDVNTTSCPELEGSFSIQMLELDVDSTVQAPHIEETYENKKSKSTQLSQPSLHLLSGKNRKLYCSKCLLLHKAALKGDMEVVKRLRGEEQQSILCAAITEGHQTLLHVAAGANQTGFALELLSLMDPEDLALQDENGNTAFCFASAAGAVDIAKVMLKMNPSLLRIRGGKNMTPLYFAALFGQKDMTNFLFHKSIPELTAEDRKVIFFASIDTGIYDLALKLLKEDRQLALVHHVKHGTALHVLARNPSAFSGRGEGPLKWLSSSILGKKCTQDIKVMNNQALELVKFLWREVIQQQDVDIAQVISKPTNLLFDATEAGNFQFLAELIGSYPDLVHELDENGRSIFHIAILHRHVNIFNLIYEQGLNKLLLATYLDSCGNNLLHLAAKYPTPNPFSNVSSAALEMQRELLTFKMVERIVQPSYREMKNSDGKTPRELFTMEHTELLRRGEAWMKTTASSCVIVATLVAVMVFAAAFIVPGGKDDRTGLPIHLTETWFQVFAISDAIAFSCSVISIAFFLSILTSRFAEDDFLKSLHLKLLFGLLTLFMSSIFMLVTFNSTFYLAYEHGLNWAIKLSIILPFVPMAAILLLQFPVLMDIFCSTYCSRF